MKYFTVLLILLICNLRAQNKNVTKEEAEKWIKSVINTYGGQIDFTDGKVIANNNYDPVFGNSTFVAKIQLIGGVEISDFTKEIRAVRLGCFEGDCASFQTKMGIVTTSRVIIQFTGMSNDLEKRLIKAFNYLIKLNGGHIIDDKF